MRVILILIISTSSFMCAMQWSASSFFLSSHQKVTQSWLYQTLNAVDTLSLSKMKDRQLILNQTLYMLSVQWDEKLAALGLELAMRLLEKGANPHYKIIVTDELCLGGGSTFKNCLNQFFDSSLDASCGSLKNFFEHEIVSFKS